MSQHFLLKVSNGNSRIMCEICAKAPEQRQQHRFCVLIVNFERILEIVTLFPLLTLYK